MNLRRPVETFGKYQVEKVLGRGGMGTVYEAVDPDINRKVALKTMIHHLAGHAELRARFLREAQAAGGLRHRNIVTVYDLGEDKGLPYIAMEFIEGTDLEKIIQSADPVSLEWKLDVIRQICEGLAHAHRMGIVHRDVKPGNIRVTPEGEVKIMDFGIAHLQSSTMTKSGLVLGTVHYMAPEQIDSKKPDHRADIFAVGVIAFELLCGRKPFEADSITGVMFRITHERPDASLLPQTAYSPGLERIILKALARKAEDRYQSLDDMHSDFEALVTETAPKLSTRADPKRATALVEKGRRHLAGGEVARALASARDALATNPGDTAAQILAREAEGAPPEKIVTEDLTVEIEQARNEGQLQKALGLCRRQLELAPDHEGTARVAAEIEGEIRSKEVEQLISVALNYAAEGDMVLALKIASKIEKIDSKHPKYLELKVYLEEEQARRTAEALVASAREHLAVGNLAEARIAAEEALMLVPSNGVAKEIRDGVLRMLATREVKPAPPAAPPPPPSAPPEPVATVAPPPAPRAAAVSLIPPPLAPAAMSPERAALPLIPPPPPPAPAAAAPPAKTGGLPLVPPPRPAPAAPLPAAQVPPPPVPRPAAPALPPIVPPPPAPAALPTRPSPPPAALEPPPAASTSAAAPVPVASAEAVLTPVPDGPPTVPEAAALYGQAQQLLKDRHPRKALPALESAAGIEPGHPGIEKLLAQTRIEARKAEIEALTTAALNHFVMNDNAKARKAVEKVLALDPANKKAQELTKILGSLG